MTTVEECCASINGGGTPSMSHPEYYGGDIPFIKSGDVKFDYVSKGALWLTSDAIEKTTARLLPAGTVLVVVRSAALKNEFHVAIAENPLVIPLPRRHTIDIFKSPRKMQLVIIPHCISNIPYRKFRQF